MTLVSQCEVVEMVGAPLPLRTISERVNSPDRFGAPFPTTRRCLAAASTADATELSTNLALAPAR